MRSYRTPPPASAFTLHTQDLCWQHLLVRRSNESCPWCGMEIQTQRWVDSADLSTLLIPFHPVFPPSAVLTPSVSWHLLLSGEGVDFLRIFALYGSKSESQKPRKGARPGSTCQLLCICLSHWGRAPHT